jgi:hypothetical protein
VRLKRKTGEQKEENTAKEKQSQQGFGMEKD